MITPNFNYSLMEVLCKELQERILGFKVSTCCPNDVYRFSIVFNQNRQQEILFFCFTPPLIRFHLVSSISSTSQSSHPLSSFLEGATLNRIALLQQDRILELTFSTLKGERKLIAEFFSKHPNYYLVESSGKILFALHSLLETHYRLPPQRSFKSDPSPWHSHQDVEQAYTEIEKQWELMKEKHALDAALSKQFKHLEKKKQKLLENLKECFEWEKMQHEGDLIKSHFQSIKKGSSSLSVQDWITGQSYHLTLDPTKTAQELMAARYKRAKKLQAGTVPLTQHLKLTEAQILSIQRQKQKLDLIKNKEELSAFKKTLQLPHPANRAMSSIKSASSKIYREYQSANGVKIWVGKNAKANESLTFQLANGRDWWLHARGFSGSHIIIRLGKDQEPDPETLKDALQLALEYSKAKSQGEAEICFTQRKYVSRLGKGKVGLVQISKHQTAWIRSDSVRLAALKQRNEKNSDISPLA